MNASQIRWRRAFLPDVRGYGTWRGSEYDHILPDSSWTLGLWPKIEQQLIRYLSDNSVQRHVGVSHLNSSWVLAANLYFPYAVLSEGYALMGLFLSSVLGLPVAEVTGIELEFADLAPHDQRTLLGESGGSRGVGMTSPDVGIRYRAQDGSRGVVLMEVKYTETGFQTCSEYLRLKGSSDHASCHDLTALLVDPTSCPYRGSGRRYVEQIRGAMVASESASGLGTCPAALGAYQLFRQQALAEALVAVGAYRYGTSVVAYPAHNHLLAASLNRIGPGQFSLAEWGTLYAGDSTFTSFHHERFLDFMDEPGRPPWVHQWLGYNRDRYFPGQ